MESKESSYEGDFLVILDSYDSTGGIGLLLDDCQQWAHVYIYAAMFRAMAHFIQEQNWLMRRQRCEKPPSLAFRHLIARLFADELEGLAFLHHVVESAGYSQLQPLAKGAASIEKAVLAFVRKQPAGAQKTFATHALKAMLAAFLEEDRLQGGRPLATAHRGPRLYHCFDSFDVILGLDYTKEKTAARSLASEERLYVGSGGGVQSGYSSILLALHVLALPKASRLVDLGSGYGRVGLAGALLWPHIRIIGFEYVPHRVDVANASSRALGLAATLDFQVKDLAHPSFTLPEAEAYYLFDPFTDATYGKVLPMIIALSRRQRLQIVTKGNARRWLLEVAQDQGWPEPVSTDNGHLAIFSTA